MARVGRASRRAFSRRNLPPEERRIAHHPNRYLSTSAIGAKFSNVSF
jgi:hypothetical protein